MNKFLEKAARFASPLFFKRGEVVSLKKGELSGVKLRVLDPKEAMVFRMHAATWEQDHFALIRRLKSGGVLPASGAVICDVGANIGLYSIWLNRLYKGDCVIHAFEPLPEAVEGMVDGLKLNEIDCIRVVSAAVADRIGEMVFFRGRHHSSGSIVEKSGTDSFTVSAITLDDYFLGDSPKPLPHFMKVDIEGAGVYALPGMLEVARKSAPVILIDSHSHEEDGAIGTFLKDLDWQAYRLDTAEWVLDRDATAPDPQGVWGTMLLCSKPMAQRVRALIH